MDGFSIDDVSASFNADVGAFLGRVEHAANAVLGTSAHAELHGLKADSDLSPFEVVAQAGHTIYGSSSLISVRSLTRCASMLEALGHVARRCVESGDYGQVRALAEYWLDCARNMRSMLALELDHKSDEAWRLALELRGRAGRWDGSLPDFEPSSPSSPSSEFRVQSSESTAPPPGTQNPEPGTLNRPAAAEAEFSFEAEPAPSSEFRVQSSELTPPPLKTQNPEPGTPNQPAEPVEPAAQAPEFSFDAEAAPSSEFRVPSSELTESPLQTQYPQPGTPNPEPGTQNSESITPNKPVVADSKINEIPGLADELLEIFQQEAREALVAIQGYLQTIVRDPQDSAVVKSLERIYHTLKGASATVGLSAISRMAAELEDSIENVLEQRQVITPEFVDDLIARTNRLLTASGLPTVDIERARGGLPPGRLDTLFVGEMSQTVKQLEAFAHTLTSEGEDARDQAAQLLHRLKGSAALFSQSAIAAEAERLQMRFQQPGAELEVLQRELLAGVGRLRALVAPASVPVGGGTRPAGTPVLPGAAGGPAGVPARGESAPVEPPSSVLVPAKAVREEVQVDPDKELRGAFETECAELLETVDKCLFSLEESPQPKNVLNELYRVYHTLKGAVNTVGLGPLGKFVHRIEDYLSELLEAAILPPMRSLTSLLLKTQDVLRQNLASAAHGYVEISLEQLSADIAQVRQGGKLDTRRGGVSTESRASASGSAPSKPDSRKPESGAPGEQADRRSIRVSTERLDALMNLTGELVVTRARMSRRVASLRAMQRELNASRKRLLTTVENFRERYEFSSRKGRRSAPAGSTGVPAGGVQRPTGTEAGATTAAMQHVFGDLELDRYDDVNILARSLNEISNDIAELQSQINAALAVFSEDSDAFSTIVSGLQTEITGARMVSVDILFARLRRPVRDAAERENKQVRVETSGEDVDLDKTIIDELYLPMLHLVRNAVAHGIESAEARLAAQKDAVGTITLSARQESGQIILEVSDDGAGLNLKALYEKGFNRGLIPAGTAADSALVTEMIFVPGISTRDVVGDVSGRGVGCDVVRRELEKLNGNIQVHTTPGKGTLFRITLPLTLAIRRALLVRQHGQMYAIPLNFAQKSVDLPDSEVVESAGIKRININGAYHPLHNLADVLKLARRATGETPAPPEATAQYAILLIVGDRRAAIAVDEVLGQEEIVVKGLGDIVSGHPLFSGVTLSGDGELILIMDVPGLVEHCLQGQSGGSLSALAARKAQLRGESGEELPQGDAGGPLKVLFVDDSLSVRKVAEKFLKNLGVQVTVAVDGLDGLEKLRQSRFDMVFTDLEMPRMHGYDLIRELRYVPAFKEIPVVVVTSRSGEKHRAQAELVGASDYVTKPFTQEILQDKLQLWARRKASV